MLSTEQQLTGCTRKRPLMPRSWQTPDKSRCDPWQRCVLLSRARTPNADALSECMLQSRAAAPCRLPDVAPCHSSAHRPRGNACKKPDRHASKGQACRGEPMQCCSAGDPRSGSRCCGWSRTAAWRTGWWWMCCGAGRSCWWPCSGGAAWPLAPPAQPPVPTGGTLFLSRTPPAPL